MCTQNQRCSFPFWHTSRCWRTASRGPARGRARGAAGGRVPVRCERRRRLDRRVRPVRSRRQQQRELSRLLCLCHADSCWPSGTRPATRLAARSRSHGEYALATRRTVSAMRRGRRAPTAAAHTIARIQQVIPYMPILLLKRFYKYALIKSCTL